MEQVVITADEILPTSSQGLSSASLAWLEARFVLNQELSLPPVSLVRTSGELLTFDGNHRLVLSKVYNRPVRGAIYLPGEYCQLPYEDILLDPGVISQLIDQRDRAIKAGILTYQDLCNMAYHNYSVRF